MGLKGITEITEQRKKEFRRDCLVLEFEDLEEIHGWLIGVAVAVERKRGVPYGEADALVLKNCVKALDPAGRKLSDMTAEEFERQYAERSGTTV